MARIGTYENDENITGTDRLLGTDHDTGRSKNYPLSSVATFLNNSGSVNILGQLTYKFVTVAPGADRTFHLPSYGGDGTSMSAVTELVFSTYPFGGYNAGAYLTYLLGKRVILAGFTDLANQSVFKITAIAETAPGSNFYNVSLTHESGAGTLDADEIYGLAAEGLTSAWGNISGDIADQTDLVNYITSVVPDVPYETAQDILDALNSLTGQYALSFTPTPLFKQGIEVGNPDVEEIGAYNLPRTALEGVIGVGNDKYGYFLFTDSNGDLNWKAFPLEFITGFDEGAQVDGGTF